MIEDKSHSVTVFMTSMILMVLLSEDQVTHFHGGEVSYAVKLKHDFHITAGETFIAPANIIIAWPGFVNVAVCKVIQAEDAIGQLTQTLGHAGKQKKNSCRGYLLDQSQRWTLDGSSVTAIYCFAEVKNCQEA